MPLPWPETMLISTHVPMRGTTFQPKCIYAAPVISTHVPMRGTTRLTVDNLAMLVISTHVPMRGTTCDVMRQCRNFFISTHVPMRGTTPEAMRIVATNGFQPTSPCGGRRRLALRQLEGVAISTHVPMRGTTERDHTGGGRTRISTHVPMRGTTRPMGVEVSNCSHFNPRPHAGDDAAWLPSGGGTDGFQPTSPCGGRRG